MSSPTVPLLEAADAPVGRSSREGRRTDKYVRLGGRTLLCKLLGRQGGVTGGSQSSIRASPARRIAHTGVTSGASCPIYERASTAPASNELTRTGTHPSRRHPRRLRRGKKRRLTRPPTMPTSDSTVSAPNDSPPPPRSRSAACPPTPAERPAHASEDRSVSNDAPTRSTPA